MPIDIPRGIFGGVLVLDHQPFVAFFALLQSHQNKAAPQLLSIQTELDFSLFQLPECVQMSLYMKSPAVPYHYRPGTVIAFRNFPFEVGIVERVILRPHRQPLVGMALRRSGQRGCTTISGWRSMRH